MSTCGTRTCLTNPGPSPARGFGPRSRREIAAVSVDTARFRNAELGPKTRARRWEWVCEIGSRATIVCAALLAGSAGAQDLELRGDATLGARFYDLESPFDDDVTSFFDQYRYVSDKDSPLPYFVDLVHLDVGLARDDDTTLVRLERFSPWDWNDRAELDVDWRGLELDLDYHRYRSEELRFFPVGTGALVPVFGTLYTPDPPFAEIFENDQRLETRRTGVGGALGLRLGDFGLENPLATELDLFSRFERRQGHQQDSFLLDAAREPVTQQTARFRGFRREIDQRVTTLGGGAVLLPWELFTGAIDVSFESFREEAPVVTLGRLADLDPRIVPATPEQAARAFQFVPDTDRWSGSFQLSRRFEGLGGATVHGGGFLTHLEQAGRRAPLQDQLGLGDDSITTWSTHGAFDLPLGESFAVGGFAKWLRRENGVDEDSFDALAPPEGQVDPVLDSRSELGAGIEATARPVAGTLAGLGYRLRWVDRDLDFAASPGAIRPAFNLQGEESEEHTTYLRAHARLLRSLQLSGEAGYAWAPQVGFPRDLESSVYARARGSYAWRKPLPTTLSVQARFLDGQNDDVDLQGADPAFDEDKEFERTEWSWGTTLATVPAESLALFASFHHGRDEQDFAHVRSNLARYLGPTGLEFFLDSEPEYTAEVRTLVVGGTQALGERVDLSLASILTWVSARFDGSGATPSALEEVDEIESRILSLEGRVGWRVGRGVSLGLGYRFDAYRDDEEHEPPRTQLGVSRRFSYDTDVHTVTFDVTVQLDAR